MHSSWANSPYTSTAVCEDESEKGQLGEKMIKMSLCVSIFLCPHTDDTDKIIVQWFLL